MDIISNAAKIVLEKAGWYEGRAISTEKNISLLKNSGYPIFDTLKEFLEEFGDLDLNFDNVFGVNIFISFDIEWSLLNAWFYEKDLIVEDYPKAIGCDKLALIGRENTQTCLAITENGIIYTLYDGYILEAGKGREAVNNLITKSYKDLKQIPIPDWWGE
ncbi:SUKH-3 domain-containing protein [Paenibacillus sp. GCM10027626]|uniref:SUKH-3 domain-containing protein n=1 Tax=Paenibacillus sp. GCM10027626 TaxID=3273411 RepID=UPI0036300520